MNQDKKIKNKEKRKKLGKKEIAKEISIRLGATALAVLTGLAEGFLTWADDTVNRRSFSQILKRGNPKNFFDYYEDYIELLKGTKKATIKVSLYRLMQKGLVEKSKAGGYKISEFGGKYLIHRNNNYTFSWDKKYRIVIFDIPEFLRRERDWFRSQLKFLEYKLLQKSVFVGKKPIPIELFEELISKKIDSYIHILTINNIDNDDILKDL